MSSSTTFVLKTDYRAPSREQLFLGTGWEPTRDVRGAFISAPKAELLIENWALSRNFASELTLIFAMSSRAAVDAMMVYAAGDFGTAQVMVRKFQQTAMVIIPLFPSVTGGHVPITLQPSFGPSETIPGRFDTMDLVALDELEIRRLAILATSRNN